MPIMGVVFAPTASSDALPDMAAKVTGLNVFPIKSCHALQVEEVQLDSRGVVDDRRFMLIDWNGRFVSQRKFPKLATVRSKFITDAQGRRLLHVSAPGIEKDLTFLPVSTGERLEVGIWQDRVKVVDQGEGPAQWFSEFIGHGGMFIRLVGTADSAHTTPTPSTSNGDSLNREVFQRAVTNLPLGLRGRLPTMELALADAGPTSLVSVESLADVNRRLKERECAEVPLNRFRMNVEVSGCCTAFEEDSWLLVKIGTVPFLVYTNAERCKVTGIDQDTGEQDKLGPLEILRAYRAPRGPGHAMFGQLMIPLQAGGHIKLGDPVEIIDKKK